jgi:hypothetical protein
MNLKRHNKNSAIVLWLKSINKESRGTTKLPLAQQITDKLNMSFSELISQMYDSSTPLETFRALKEAYYPTAPSKAEFNEIVNTLSEALRQNKVRKALSITRVLLLISADNTIYQIRRKGVFRCSRYQYRERVVRAVVGDLLLNTTAYGFTQAHIDYLQSVDNLLALGPNLQHKRASIIKRLRSKESVVIKTLLANVESFFTNGLPGDKSLSSADSLQAYSPEEMAEAFSYLLRLFQECVGLKQMHFGMADESSVEKPFYEELLVDSAKMCEFHNVEVLIDAFPYRAIVDGKIVKVESVDPLLEKSIKIGYMQVIFQSYIRAASLRQEEHSAEPVALSMTRFAKECFDHAGEELVTLVQNPRPRYVMMLPTNHELFEPFSADHLFLEDLSYLKMLGIEDYIAENVVVELPVKGNITVIDIIKVQRFIRFAHLCFLEAFNRHPMEAGRAKIQLQSCIPVFKADALLQLLSQLLPSFKAEEMLTLLTCDTASAKYIDLQYMPIISAKGRYMFAPAVLANSNLVRNLLCHNSERLTLRDKTDPMQTALADALKRAGFLVKIELKRRVEGRELEIDILAYRDECLFIFECKNAYHPCNVYEMRNSYEHITHAAKQLEKRKAWLLDQSKQQALFQSLGWDIEPTNRVMTCIAIGNRVFNGYECAGHPVRQVRELVNVLESGEVVIDDEKRRLWKNSSFSIDDLVAHLAGETFIADFLEALQPEIFQFKFGSKALALSTYSLDFDELAKIVKSRYPLIESVIS